MQASVSWKNQLGRRRNGVAFAKEDDRGICEQMDQTLEEMRQDGTS